MGTAHTAGEAGVVADQRTGSGLASHSLSLHHHGGQALGGGIYGGRETGGAGSHHHHIEDLVRRWWSRHPHCFGNLEVTGVLEDNWWSRELQHQDRQHGV